MESVSLRDKSQHFHLLMGAFRQVIPTETLLKQGSKIIFLKSCLGSAGLGVENAGMRCKIQTLPFVSVAYGLAGFSKHPEKLFLYLEKMIY